MKLMGKVPSRTQKILDEKETVNQSKLSPKLSSPIARTPKVYAFSFTVRSSRRVE